MAFLLYSLLPNIWDGASGSYMGKDWNTLSMLFDMYEVDYKREVFYFMKMYEVYMVDVMNKKLTADRKREERKHKSSSG